MDEPKKMPEMVVVAQRAMELEQPHPLTDYGFCCFLCGERVGLCPSSVEMLKRQLGMEVICINCVGTIPGKATLLRTWESEQEMKEAAAFHKGAAS